MRRRRALTSLQHHCLCMRDSRSSVRVARLPPPEAYGIRRRRWFRDSHETVFAGPDAEIPSFSGLIVPGRFPFQGEQQTIHRVSTYNAQREIKMTYQTNVPTSFDAFEPMRLVFNAIYSSGVSHHLSPPTSLHLSSDLFLLAATLWTHCQ